MQVIGKWKKKLQGTKAYLSQESDILQLKTCVDIALRCVKDERNERPDIKGIVNELEKLEPQIDKISTDPAYYRSGVRQDIRQKEHLFHLYMTQRGIGTTDSNEKFVVDCGFGSIVVDDFTIRDGPTANANLVGRARGMHVHDGIGDDHWLFCHSIVFTDTRFSSPHLLFYFGHVTYSKINFCDSIFAMLIRILINQLIRFKGSSLKMLGDFAYENDAEWAIVGGTGEFAYANGAVTAKIIQPHTPDTGRIWDLRIRAFCLCISEKVRCILAFGLLSFTPLHSFSKFKF